MRRRFFVNRFEDGSAILGGDAANHLGRVLRAETGQLFELSDGEALWLARIDQVNRDEIRFALVEPLPVPAAPVRISLLLAIVKFDRFEWALEKATELGVDEIVPLTAERTEKGLIAAAANRAGRWERILSESAQQSRRLRVPVLHAAANPHHAFRISNAQVRVLLSERAQAKPMREILEPATARVNASDATGVAIAVGPEGGWTDAEFSMAATVGFSEAALGINILRTETAVCAAVAAIQYAFGAVRAGDAEERSHGDRREENA